MNTFYMIVSNHQAAFKVDPKATWVKTIKPTTLKAWQSCRESVETGRLPRRHLYRVQTSLTKAELKAMPNVLKVKKRMPHRLWDQSYATTYPSWAA